MKKFNQSALLLLTSLVFASSSLAQEFPIYGQELTEQEQIEQELTEGEETEVQEHPEQICDRAYIYSYYCEISRTGNYADAENYYCEDISIYNSEGEVVRRGLVCGLPEDPFTLPVDDVYGADGATILGCEQVEESEISPVSSRECIDLIRTIECDNPIKEVIPQEIRNDVKDLLRGFFK